MSHRSAVQRAHSQGSGDSAASRDDTSYGTSPSQLAAGLPRNRRRRLALHTGLWVGMAALSLIALAVLTERIVQGGIRELMAANLGSLRDNASSRLVDALEGLQDSARRMAEEAVPDSGELARMARQAGVDDLLVLGPDARPLAASGRRIPPLSSALLQRVSETVSGTALLPVDLGILSSQGNAAEDPGELPLVGAIAVLPPVDGRRRGWLMARVAAVPLFTNLFASGRPGDSGETYLFDGRGLLLSRSRFEDELRRMGVLSATHDSALRISLRDPGNGALPVAARPLTLLAARALTVGKGLSLEPYRDYRGVEVIGAWDWIPAYGIGVAVEMDRTEAFAAVGRLHLVFLGLLGLLGLLLLGLLWWWRRAAVLRARARRAERRVRELGQYQLLELIGRGGMGRVYRARHRLLRRPTAIKLLLTEQATPEDLLRFEREANLTANLTSPHTVRVFDFGQAQTGEFYIVMELLEGLDLTRLVVDHGPQPEARVIHWMVQACDSLAEAHEQHLIHRDLKPQNLFTCRQGRHRDMLKVLDFGLAKQVKQPGLLAVKTTAGLTGYGQVAGTPGFMAPEQAMGAVIDPRIDLYALGCCMYWLLTGGQVFPHDQGADSVYKHLHVMPEPPSSRRPPGAISPGMDAVVLRLLAKDANARFADAVELAAALRALPLHGAWTDVDAEAWWRRIGSLPNASAVATAAPLPDLPGALAVG